MKIKVIGKNKVMLPDRTVVLPGTGIEVDKELGEKMIALKCGELIPEIQKPAGK